MSYRIHDMSDALETAQKFYDDLNSEVNDLRNRCAELEREVEDLKESNDVLSCEVRDSEACFSELKAAYDNLTNIQINDL